MKFTFILVVFLLSACSHPGRTPLHEVAAAQPEPAPIFRSLEDKKISEDKKQPFFTIKWADRSIRVAHGKWQLQGQDADWNRMYGWGPIVSVTVGKRTRVLDLRKDYPSNYVAHVFQDETGGRILLFLDYGIEGPERAFHVWITEDRGEHWFAGADLKRPPESFPPANLDNFFLDSSGQGSALFRIEAASLPKEGRGFPPQADVFYFARTRDGGRSWETDNSPAFSSVVHQEEERHH